ncbi:MAG: Clp protease N-terminal domain-containing protein, partial [Candidatus Promineifilaceae bacterium]
MRIDKFTQKSQEALQEAQQLASEYNHPNIEPVHLLKALLDQDDGVVRSVLRRIGSDVDLLEQSVDQELAKLPRATGASMQVGLS